MKIPNYIYERNPTFGEMIKNRSILKMYRGSVTHGTYLKTGLDDLDFMMVTVPPLDYFFGLNAMGSRGTVEIMFKEFDIVAYDNLKFISLLTKGNPNAIGMLWLRKNYYINIEDAGKLLLENRDIFTSKKMYMPFLGYARSQFHRMKAIKTGAGYAGKKRKQIIKKFGYDTKNASHLIRLLRMGIEFLSTGELQVFRPDRKELIEIKTGEWSYLQVTNEAGRLFKLLEESLVHSKLNNEPNISKINDLSIEVTKLALETYGDL